MDTYRLRGRQNSGGRKVDIFRRLRNLINKNHKSPKLLFNGNLRGSSDAARFVC